ncbi:hypothetical protein WJX81_002254 [Elliptochloris bilobata]|uniref:Uncharacterized protein n=1 Tax=Elliptochloris bilobata TaxID=381761 RepID=A0AAW1S2Y4_9CHLO
MLAAELAQADARGGAGDAPAPHKRECAATLSALAQQSASFSPAAAGGSGSGPLPADPLADLARLSEQLTAMGAAADGKGGNTGAGGRGGSGGGDAGFAEMADFMLHQLLSKEVLLQPMMDIGAKYPAWLDAHRAELPPAELARYEAQQRYIARIVAVYQRDPDNFAELFSLIQQMQACGQPPQEIVDELAPGLQFDADGAPQMGLSGAPAGGGAPPIDPANCSVQ